MKTKREDKKTTQLDTLAGLATEHQLTPPMLTVLALCRKHGDTMESNTLRHEMGYNPIQECMALRWRRMLEVNTAYEDNRHYWVKLTVEGVTLCRKLEGELKSEMGGVKSEAGNPVAKMLSQLDVPEHWKIETGDSQEEAEDWGRWDGYEQEHCVQFFGEMPTKNGLPSGVPMPPPVPEKFRIKLAVESAADSALQEILGMYYEWQTILEINRADMIGMVKAMAEHKQDVREMLLTQKRLDKVIKPNTQG